MVDLANHSATVPDPLRGMKGREAWGQGSGEAGKRGKSYRDEVIIFLSAGF